LTFDETVMGGATEAEMEKVGVMSFFFPLLLLYDDDFDAKNPLPLHYPYLLKRGMTDD
jgi:hypothetical protein